MGWQGWVMCIVQQKGGIVVRDVWLSPPLRTRMRLPSLSCSHFLGPYLERALNFTIFPYTWLGRVPQGLSKVSSSSVKLSHPPSLSATKVGTRMWLMSVCGNAEFSRNTSSGVSISGLLYRALAYRLLCSSSGCLRYLLPFIKVAAAFMIQPKTLHGRSNLGSLGFM